MKFFNFAHLEQTYGTNIQFWRKHRIVGNQNDQLEKKNLLVKEFFKSDHLEQSYGTKYWILKIT